MSKKMIAKKSSNVSSLEKSIIILKTLGNSVSELDLQSISAETAFSISTVYRLLSTLEDHNLVSRDPGTKKYRLGVGIIHLAEAAKRHINLLRIAQPILEDLSKITDETANLDILINNRSTIIAQSLGVTPIALKSVLGSQVHLHASASGKVLLSGMSLEKINEILDEGMPAFTPNTITNRKELLCTIDAIQKNGYSFDDEERCHGVYCIGTPVFNHENRVIAAIHISSPATKRTKEEFLSLVPSVISAGKQLSKELGWNDKQSIY